LSILVQNESAHSLGTTIAGNFWRLCVYIVSNTGLVISRSAYVGYIVALAAVAFDTEKRRVNQ